MNVVQRILTPVFALAALSITPNCRAQAPGDGGAAFMAGASVVQTIANQDRAAPQAPLTPEQRQKDDEFTRHVFLPGAGSLLGIYLGYVALSVIRDQRQMREINRGSTLKL